MFHGQLSVVSGVRKQKVRAFPVRESRFDEIPVRCWNVAECGSGLSLAGVRFEGGSPTHSQPAGQRIRIPPSIQQLLFVVSKNGDQANHVSQTDQAFDHLSSLWPAIGKVSQDDQRIDGCQMDRVQQGIERFEASMDVPNGQQPTRRG